MKKAYLQPSAKMFAVKSSKMIAGSKDSLGFSPSRGTNGSGITSNDAKEDEEDTFDW